MDESSSTYRLLTDGDTIQATDEWLQEDAQTWVKSPGWAVGMEYRRGRALLPARRELGLTIKLSGGPNGPSDSNAVLCITYNGEMKW